MKTAIVVQVFIVALLLGGIYELSSAWQAEVKAETARTIYADSVSSDDAVAVATGLTNRTLFVAIPHAGQAECDHFLDVIVTDRSEMNELRQNEFDHVQCLDSIREVK